MRLHDLKPRPGAKHRRKRLGQGESSGHGKTSGGAVAKASPPAPAVRFELDLKGGQMPLIRRIPKRGFNNARHATVYIPVNLEGLEQFEEGARVDEAALRAVGLANGPGAGVKVLGNGKLSKKLTVVAHKFSATAQKAIEAAGGVCELYSKVGCACQGRSRQVDHSR